MHRSCKLQRGALSRRVQLTIVGLDGKRHLVRGLEGQALVNVLHANEDAFGSEGEWPSLHWYLKLGRPELWRLLLICVGRLFLLLHWP